MPGVLLTQWTIRLALVCFVAYLGGGLVARGPRWQRIGRWIWTLGCGLFLVHVACAFQFYHHWSHAAAWEETARQTRELMGFEFGDGIYFSYLFLVLWVGDVIGLWSYQPEALARDPLARNIPSLTLRVSVRGAVLAFLAFIAFNGAIVFEGGPTRWFGLAACLALAGLAIRAGYNRLSAIRDTASAQKVRPSNAECGVQIAE
jgi:hypothetical protein